MNDTLHYTPKSRTSQQLKNSGRCIPSLSSHLSNTIPLLFYKRFSHIILSHLLFFYHINKNRICFECVKQ